MFQTCLGHHRFTFADTRKLLNRASAQKSGDGLAGLVARSAQEHEAAHALLTDIPPLNLLHEPPIPYEAGKITP